MLDTQTLHEWFDYFNHLCFQDKLPVPCLLLSKSRTRLGSMTYRRERRYVIFSQSSFTLRVSTYYESTEQELQDVLLHEMIHYFIAYNKLRDTSPHGTLFRKMMCEINQKYHRNITISSRSAEKRSASMTRQPRERLILAMEMSGEAYYLTVVNPRYAKYIQSRLPLVKGLTHCEWFVSIDPFFDDYPAVRTLRARQVARETFQQKVDNGLKTDV